MYDRHVLIWTRVLQPKTNHTEHLKKRGFSFSAVFALNLRRFIITSMPALSAKHVRRGLQSFDKVAPCVGAGHGSDETGELSHSLHLSFRKGKIQQFFAPENRDKAPNNDMNILHFMDFSKLMLKTSVSFRTSGVTVLEGVSKNQSGTDSPHTRHFGPWKISPCHEV